MRIGIIILLVSCVCTAQTARRRTGKYTNPALGYAVIVPEGLVGETGTRPAPKKDSAYRCLPAEPSLSSANPIVTNGGLQPAAYGIPSGRERCNAVRQQTTGYDRMGRLTATKGALACRDRLLEMRLAFRPGGGPIYCMRLRTNLQKKSRR